MPNPVTCAFDACCTFTPPVGVSNAKYCPDHRCKRKAENARKELAEADLFETPRKFTLEKVTSAPDGARVIIVNDTQIPFQDDATLEAVEKFWDDFAPTYEVYAGDIADFYSISAFDQNPSRRFNLQNELDVTRGWMNRRATANPGAKRYFIEGNHEDRLRRYLWRKTPALDSLRGLDTETLLGLKDVGATVLPYMSVLDFLGFRIEHGWKASSGTTPYPINVSRFMAAKTGSSGLCGHTHRYSVYAWTDSRGSHSYIENGCLCRMDLEYAPFPNWQQAFTYGIVHQNKVHLVPVQIYPNGFRAEGEFYARGKRGRR